MKDDMPTLSNLLEIARLLASKTGVEVEKHNDREHYDLIKLENELTRLGEKEVKVKLLEEEIRSKEKKINRFSNELREAEEKEKFLNGLIFSINSDNESRENLEKDNKSLEKELQEKTAEVKKQENKILELVEELDNSKKKEENFQRIISSNANREREQLEEI